MIVARGLSEGDNGDPRPKGYAAMLPPHWPHPPPHPYTPRLDTTNRGRQVMRRFAGMLVAGAVLAGAISPGLAQERSMEFQAGFAGMAQRLCKFAYHKQAQRDLDTIRREAAGNAWRMAQLAEGEAAAKALGTDCKTMGATVASYSW